jgi:DNA-binding LacI/PurR family transcriptional regulator
MPRVSLRQIAEKIGCSRSTVSYALKNHPSISVEMRERVKQVANDLGWTPDAMLARQMALVRQTLSDTNNPNLALVTNRARDAMHIGFAFRLVYEGVLKYAEKRGYSVSVINLADEPVSPQRLKGILEARGIQGLVFVASVDAPVPLEYLQAGEPFACAVAGVRYPEMPYHVAIPDWTSAGRIALQKLYGLGYKRPGVIMPYIIDKEVEWGFTSGFAAGVAEVSPDRRLPVLDAGTTETHIPESEYDRCLEYMREYRPDCILTTDVTHPPKLFRRLRRKKKPDLFALDLYRNAEYLKGGISQWHPEVGRAAVDLVISQIHRGEYGVPNIQKAVEIEGHWVMADAFDFPETVPQNRQTPVTA